MKKTLYLIRHGQALHNINFIKYGSNTYYNKINLDAPLTHTGIEQALDCASSWNLKNDIEAVVTSSLTRTLQTTQFIFGKTPNIPVLVLDELKEFPQGLHTTNKRQSLSTLKENFSFDFSKIRHENDLMWSPVLEENEKELEMRVLLSKKIIKKLPYNNIAVVSHSSFLHYFISQELEKPESYGSLPHCEPILFHLE